MYLLLNIFVGFVVACTFASTTPIQNETSSLDNRIFNGAPAYRGQFPYIVVLTLHNRAYCGGAILSPWWILTAGHCVDEPQEKSMVVIAGVVNLAEPHPHIQNIPVASYFIHPGYTNTLANDIAMLKLQSGLVFNPSVASIPIAHGSVELLNQPATICGWGTTQSGSSSNILLHYSAPLYHSSECQDKVTYPIYDKEKTICTFSPQHLTCRGDSGGPLVQNGLLIGVVSAGGSECRLGYATIYTKVSRFADFIRQYLN